MFILTKFTPYIYPCNTRKGNSLYDYALIRSSRREIQGNAIISALKPVSILMNLARDLSDYFQFFGRKLHIVIFLALSKAFSAGLKAFP